MSVATPRLNILRLRPHGGGNQIVPPTSPSHWVMVKGQQKSGKDQSHRHDITHVYTASSSQTHRENPPPLPRPHNKRMLQRLRRRASLFRVEAQTPVQQIHKQPQLFHLALRHPPRALPQ